MATQLTYLDESQRLTAEAQIIRVDRDGEDSCSVVLDQTLFHPQGGGQPADRGVISTGTGSLLVEGVAFADGEVLHRGIEKGTLAVGDSAHVAVDAETRRVHSLLHTGGHVVMTAVDRLTGQRPGKGYHFPAGPYVEFAGAPPERERTGLAERLQAIMDRLIAEDSAVTSHYEDVGRLRAEGVYFPADVPAGKPTRVVVTAGYRSPCGGTHVRRLGELAGLRVKAVKVKSGRTRVSYLVG